MKSMSDHNHAQLSSAWSSPTQPRPIISRNNTARAVRHSGHDHDPQIIANSQPNPLRGSNESNQSNDHEDFLHPRRSSLAERIGLLSSYGGPNSLSNFASSFQRAAGFYQITHRPSQAHIRASDGADDSPQPDLPELEQGTSRHSLHRSALDRERHRPSDHAVLDDDEVFGTSPAPSDVTARIAEHRRLSSVLDSSRQNIFDREPEPGPSPQHGSYDASYGSLASRLNEPARREAGKLFARQQATGTSVPDKEREPLLTKPVRQSHGGGAINVVVGQSTLPQTIFNSVNVLIGVGMLSLPLAIRYSGWIIGMGFFLLSAIGTSYTARLLAKCIDVDQSLITFADIAYVSFGQRARVMVSILFSLELLGVCVALVILFADSVDLLIVGWGTVAWKIVCGILIIPLSFLPMRFLSFTSILGILCCILSKQDP